MSAAKTSGPCVFLAAPPPPGTLVNTAARHDLRNRLQALYCWREFAASDKERALVGALIGEYQERLAGPKPEIPDGYSPHVHVSEVQP